jgi:hypothetical protein
MMVRLLFRRRETLRVVSSQASKRRQKSQTYCGCCAVLASVRPGVRLQSRALRSRNCRP